MVVIATFKALPFSAFSNPPGGGNDPFVLSTNDPAQLLNVSIDDDDMTIDGDTVSNEVPNDANQIATVTDANGNLLSVDASYVEWTATYTGSNGQVIEVWRIELDNGLRLFAVSEIPEVGVTFTTNNKDQSADGLDPADIPDTPCFVRGTLIETSCGPKPIEVLRTGDDVLGYGGKLLKLRKVFRRSFNRRELAANEKLYPVRITAGALGEGLPRRDMLVSRQHRMLVSSKIVKRMFGQSDALIPAIRLVTVPGIFIDWRVLNIEYFHLLFDQHEVIFAEGTPSESLLTGKEAINCLGPEILEEVQTIFPELMDQDCFPVPACFIPEAKQQKKLIARHLKNNKPLFER